MSKLKTAALFATAILVAGAAGGGVGAGAAIALVRNVYDGPSRPVVPSEITVESDVLGEPMVLGVRLPLEYHADPDARFPVVWVLDGASQGPGAAQTIESLSRIGVAASSIVIEMPSSSRGRAVDFTPSYPDRPGPVAQSGAERYLSFLATEAIPSVENAYRTSAHRLLVGHSLGGLFALAVFARQPSLFGGYFVFSPSVWVNHEAIVADVGRAIEEGSDPRPDLYVSLGADEGNRMRSGFEALAAVLGRSSPEVLRWRADITAGADHGSNPRLSLPVALDWYGRRGEGR